MAPVQVTIHDLLGLCFFAIATLPHLRPDGQRWLLCLASAVLWLPGLAIHWYARRVQLVWLADRLRYRNLFRTRELLFTDIVSWNYGADFEFETRQGPPFRVTKTLAFDEAFLAWLRQYPNRTAELRANTEKQIKDALPQWVVGALLGAWGWLHPQPFPVVVLVLLLAPWMMIFWIRARPRQSQPVDELVCLAWLFPATALSNLANKDARLLVVWAMPEVALGGVIGLLLLAAFFRAHPALCKNKAALLSVVFLWTPIAVYGQVAAVGMLWKTIRSMFA
ncbi:MAG: hypothetical protein JNK87_34340 [Bryobacterales bacterium]|nr:hypothetical protein [Bryobacterales bacterium]